MKFHRYIHHHLWSSINIIFVAVLVLSTSCTGINLSDLPEPDQKLLKSEANYESEKIGQFIIHYPIDSYTATQIPVLEEEFEAAKLKALNIIGVQDYTEKVHYIFFKDEEAFDKHINTISDYFVNSSNRVAYIIHNEERRPYITHTLFRIMAFDNWGPPKSGLFAIGGAMYADAKCQDFQYPLDDVGSYLLQAEKLISYKVIFRDFNKVRDEYPKITEIQSAAFFQFVYDNFGREKMKRLWTKKVRGTLGVIGMGELEVANEIIGRWRKMNPSQEIDWEEIEKFGC